MPRKVFDFQEEYDEYIENTPLEARFDYLTIQVIVSEGFEKHKAYGMSFDEYRMQRAKMAGYDETAKKRLSFYLPPYYARVASDLAMMHKSSLHHFMVLMIELGLIHFQVDYHDEYEIIRDGRNKLFKKLDAFDGENIYMQLDKQVISLGSCSGSKFGKIKHFVPSVPEWLYNACADVSTYLNMPVSDLVFLCFCISVINCLDDSTFPQNVVKNSKETCAKFDFEINTYSRRISELLTI